MDEFIARLEAATEGSRVLDVLVRNHAEGIEGYDSLEKDVAELDRDGCPLEEIPRYTTSLDAAMTLVPEGYTRGMLTWPGYSGGVYSAPVKATLYSQYSSGGEPREIAYAQTRPLALCIAALKARKPQP